MKRTLISALVSVCIIILFNIWACNRWNTENYASLNDNDDVQFVAINSCRSCHEEIYNDYILTGMGKSFYRPDPNQRIESFDRNAPVFDSLTKYYYLPFWEGKDFFVKEFRLENGDTTYKRVEKIDYVVGSGNATRSYLIERKGYIYEVPITWYVQRKKWDLSPGYDAGNNSRFGRAVGKECMACHNGHFEFDEGTVNRYKKLSLGIDCESCHGAGSEHVKQMTAGNETDVGKKIDYSIVNPKKLDIEKSFDVCQQCHLQGTMVFKGNEKFRPAELLNQSREVFIPIKKDLQSFSISSHAERLRLSTCFIQSQNKLTCISCHNPHKSIHKTDPQFFNKTCAKCHSSNACTEKKENKINVNNNCIHCHLPKGGTSDIPHVRFTDHYIRVVGKELKKQPSPVTQSAYLSFLCATSTQPNNDFVGKAYLTYFERNSANPAFLKIALEKLSAESHYERAKAFFFLNQKEEALKEIELSLKDNNKNTWALFLKGEILEARQQYQASADVYKIVFQLNPSITEAGVKASVMLLKAQPVDADIKDQAAKLLQQVISIKPHEVSALVNLGVIRLNQNQLSDARKYLEQALSYEPDHLLAKQNLSLTLQKMNKSR